MPHLVSDNDFGTSEDDWELVSGGSVYTPVTADVGRTLKVECCAVSLSNSCEIIAGPETVYTAVVLDRPEPPPARIRRSVNSTGFGPGVSLAGKFRVMSYNILSEVYATKQVSHEHFCCF